MRLALIGDIHFYRLWIRPWHLLGKTLLGQANLWCRRRHRFNAALLEQTLLKVSAVEPDMLLCSGDLTTTGQSGEFLDVKQVLSRWMTRWPMVIVPGNHDRYSFSATRSRRLERMMGDVVPSTFPMARRLNEGWWLLALDSCVPRVWSSRGELGREQLDAARAFLDQRTAGEGVVVLCHYPFAVPPGCPAMKAHHVLADAAGLRDLLAGCEARVVMMHGHVHCPWCWDLGKGGGDWGGQGRGDLSHVTVINAGSPTLVGPKHPQGQGFWVIELPESAEKPKIVHHSPTLGYRVDML